MLDPSFVPATAALFDVNDPDSFGRITVVASQPDGKALIACGDCNLDFRQTGNSVGIARLNADGSLDPGFDPGTGAEPGVEGDFIYAMVVQPDGKIVVGGAFPRFNGVVRNGIVRLNPNGSTDPTFNAGAGVLRMAK
jgi:uncharacterized delta-60 repeat protein